MMARAMYVVVLMAILIPAVFAREAWLAVSLLVLFVVVAVCWPLPAWERPEPPAEEVRSLNPEHHEMPMNLKRIDDKCLSISMECERLAAEERERARR